MALRIEGYASCAIVWIRASLSTSNPSGTDHEQPVHSMSVCRAAAILSKVESLTLTAALILNIQYAPSLCVPFGDSNPGSGLIRPIRRVLIL